MSRPLYILSPYWMGDFSPLHAAVARHNWRLLATPLPSGPPTKRMGSLGLLLADEVAAVLADGHLPVVIAGDCTATIGVLAGLQRETPDLNLVWFDAHGDFNTHETTPSNFIGGMPLAMLCGRGEQTIVEMAGGTIQPEEDIILTDARDLDSAEAEALASSKIRHLMNVVDVTSLSLPEKPIYVHFDCDVLQLSDLSAVSYPAKDGPTLEVVNAALSHLAATGCVAAVSVSMWNPELDESGTGQALVLDIVQRFVDQC